MAKNTVADYSKTASQNTDIAGVDIDEGCSPAGVNNAIREVMADIAAVYDGTQALASPDINGGTINGATINNSAIGGTTAAAGSFTQVNSSGAVIATGAGTFGDDVDITGDVTVTGSVTAASFSGDGSGLSNLFIAGMIMLWSGSIASIPTGWVLCNGQNGSPDLRNRFVTGAGDTYAVNATGGQNSITGVPAHTHTFTANTGSAGSHSHTGTTAGAGAHIHTNARGGSDVVGPSVNEGINTTLEEGAGVPNKYRSAMSNPGNHQHTFTTNTEANHQHSVSGTTASTGSSSIDIRPLYYALAYIMKT
jgi:hypothetical protein